MMITVESTRTFWATHTVEADDHAEAAEIVRDMDDSTYYDGVKSAETAIFDSTDEVPE